MTHIKHVGWYYCWNVRLHSSDRIDIGTTSSSAWYLKRFQLYVSDCIIQYGIRHEA